MNRRLRRLLLATTGVTAFTALVGVYTAEFGAGLACDARWPLCDGAVYGLFPANLPSFIEWFHRLVAMIAGFLVLGTTGLVWTRGESRRIRLATLGALVVLPTQIVLGALTVTTYRIAVLTAHFATAALILGLLIAATVWAYADAVGATLPRIRRAALAVLLAVPVLVALTPRLFVVYRDVVQLTYYGLGFGIFAALCVVVLWARELDAGETTAVWAPAAAATFLVPAVLVGGRLHFGDAGQLLLVGATLAVFGLTLASFLATRRLQRRRL